MEWKKSDEHSLVDEPIRDEKAMKIILKNDG